MSTAVIITISVSHNRLAHKFRHWFVARHVTVLLW